MSECEIAPLIYLPRSKKIQINNTNKINNVNNNSTHNDLSNQYDLKENQFDPFSSSPPQYFMMKLKERIKTYNAFSDYSLSTNDLMRKSE